MPWIPPVLEPIVVNRSTRKVSHVTVSDDARRYQGCSGSGGESGSGKKFVCRRLLSVDIVEFAVCGHCRHLLSVDIVDICCL